MDVWSSLKGPLPVVKYRPGTSAALEIAMDARKPAG